MAFTVLAMVIKFRSTACYLEMDFNILFLEGQHVLNVHINIRSACLPKQILEEIKLQHTLLEKECDITLHTGSKPLLDHLTHTQKKKKGIPKTPVRSGTI